MKMKEIAVIEDDREEDEDHQKEEEACIKWYAFYSEKQGREYYFNPKTRVVTWILPDDIHPQGVAVVRETTTAADDDVDKATTAEKSISRRVSFCSNDSDSEEDESRDETEDIGIKHTAHPQEHQKDRPHENKRNKSRGMPIQLGGLGKDQRMSQSKTTSSEKSKKSNAIIWICAVVSTVGSLVLQSQQQHHHDGIHLQHNVAHEKPTMLDNIAKVPMPPVPPPPPPPPQPVSQFSLTESSMANDSESDQLSAPKPATIDTVSKDEDVEVNDHIHTEPKGGEKDMVNMVTSDDKVATATPDNNIDVSRDAENEIIETDLELSTQHEAKQQHDGNPKSKVISTEVEDTPIKNTATNTIRLEIEVDIVEGTLQNKKVTQQQVLKDDNIETSISGHEDGESSYMDSTKGLFVESGIEQEEEATENESLNTAALLQLSQSTIKEAGNENSNNQVLLEPSEGIAGDEQEDTEDDLYEKEDSMHEAEPSGAVQQDESQGKLTDREKESPSKTELTDNNIATAEDIAKKLSPMIQSTVKIGTFEDFVAQNDHMLMQKFDNNEKVDARTKSGCLVPFAHLFSKKCRNEIKKKPVFDLKGLVDSMLQ